MKYLSQLVENANITTLTVGLIALAGVILSAFISAFVSRRSTYINSVTVERSKWTDKLRNNISECVGSLGYLHYKTMLEDDFAISEDHDELIKKNEIMLNVI